MSEYRDPLAPKIELKQEGDNFTVTSTSSVSPSNASYADLQGFLKVEHPSGKEQSQLEAINEYLKGKTDLERLTTIRHLENRLGTPRVGESRLGNIYKFIKLDNMAKEYGTARDSLLA